MRQISPVGQRELEDLARRHGFGPEAAAVLLDALIAGGGGMAQFSHPEFGGAGQWMRGGMSQIGDMFNAALKARVNALCGDLSSLAASSLAARESDAVRSGTTQAGNEPWGGDGFAAQRDAASGRWWPSELGEPNSAGAQNDSRYAYFAGPHRLAIETRGTLTIHDTLDHRIGGVSQSQRSADGSLAFTSQHGSVDVASLPIVSGSDGPSPARVPAPPVSARPASASPAAGDTDVLATIERLADLHGKGILSDAEFATKKAELLARL